MMHISNFRSIKRLGVFLPPSHPEWDASFLKSQPAWRGGLMASALVPGASGLVSSHGRGHYVVFLGKTLKSHSAFLQLWSINGYRRIVGET